MIMDALSTTKDSTMNSTSSTRVALVTGASRGIGAAIARRLARDGVAVAVNYASKEAEAQAQVDAIVAAGGRAVAVRGDVADPAGVKRMFDTAEAALGRIDILVNNAGIMLNATIADSSDDLFARSFAVNVQGSFNTMREAAGRLNDGGRIVNFSTSVLGLALPTYGVYVATKAAVEAMTRVFAKELRGRAISCNAVAPGPVATELFLDGETEDQVKQYAMMPPLERLGQPQDIAGLVSFLAGPDGAWINGQVLRANGGIV
jgi:3-oxoacyl-[acyl-carrier protein] reductase